jgi:polysaccharide chain length determinant protein (PEP-CTERM system associated)
MLPGRRYTPSDILHIGLRFKWLILLPWVVVATTVIVYGRTIPDRYRSESLIQVVPQRVPTNLVRSTVTAGLDQRLPVISAQILSRTRLERIIQDFRLYEEERRTKLMEDIVADMRDDIDVDPVKGDAFRVRYESNDARTAMRVTERLASLFLDENRNDREALAEGATGFLDSELDEARRTLAEQEKKLEDYRRQHKGELPSQLSANLQQANNLSNQIQQNQTVILSEREKRFGLERQINDLENESISAQQVVTPDPAAATAQPAAAALRAAQAQLAQMELVRKADHPEVRILRRVISDLEAKAAAEALASPVSAGIAPNPAEMARQKKIQEFREQIQTIDRNIAGREANVAELQRKYLEVERRIDATATRESELVALTRDYGTLQRMYDSTFAKSVEAKTAAKLERRQIGESFKVIDPARVPEKPFTPDRLRINLGGIIGGLVLGLALVGLLEFRDSTFRNDHDVVTVLSLPVLATIPAIMTSQDYAFLRRRRLLVTAASIVVAGVFGAALVAWRMNLLQRLL